MMSCSLRFPADTAMKANGPETQRRVRERSSANTSSAGISSAVPDSTSARRRRINWARSCGGSSSASASSCSRGRPLRLFSGRGALRNLTLGPVKCFLRQEMHSTDTPTSRRGTRVTFTEAVELIRPAVDGARGTWADFGAGRTRSSAMASRLAQLIPWDADGRLWADGRRQRSC